MKRASFGALALGVAAGPVSAAGQASGGSQAAVSIPATGVHDLYSEHVGREVQLWVAEPVPGSLPFPPGPRSVLSVLDANLFLGTAVDMTRLMSQL